MQSASDDPAAHVGLLEGAHDLLRRFSPAERLLLYVLSVALALSAFVLFAQVNAEVSSRVPAAGGSFVEGAVGTPRFVNPLLAATPIDQDLTMLVYSGLLRLRPDGSFEPDLAVGYDISESGTVYTFRLREGLTFHDGTPLTADDVLFTVRLAQNPDIKSPRRADWEGILVEAPDVRTIVFRLPHAYAPFLENATLGVLPKTHWEGVATQEFPFHSLNTHPVGSGPYEVRDVTLDSAGAPTTFSLRAFSGFALGEPHISTITYQTYPNESALAEAAAEGTVDSFVIASPKTATTDLQESARFLSVPLTRVFGIFFNQNHAPTLADASVRSALNTVVNKETVVADVLGGFGSVLTGPVPGLGAVAGASRTADNAELDPTAEARNILERGGWKYHEGDASSTPSWTKGETTLSITLATVDTEELVQSAEAVAGMWRALGVHVEVRVYPLSEFNQSILRPRQYDAILFGEVVGRSLDLYPFWHSSQRNDPGLNLSLYANTEADRALSEARAATDIRERERLIRDFAQELAEDSPAVFLYAPDIAYYAPDVEGVETGTLTVPAERFAGVYTWYRDTERVWEIFNQ